VQEVSLCTFSSGAELSRLTINSAVRRIHTREGSAVLGTRDLHRRHLLSIAVVLNKERKREREGTHELSLSAGVV